MIKFILFLFAATNLSFCENLETNPKWPTVCIAVLVRNKAHTLPYFLSSLQNLDYPKDRLNIWIYSDFNEDNSIVILSHWEELYSSQYNGVNITTNNSSGLLHNDEQIAFQWTPNHFKHVIMLREEALDYARRIWADYLFVIDADVFLLEPITLKGLIQKELPIVAPMLLSDGLYSNFWCGMTESYYYKRTDDYKPILNREQIGCFSVPMIHTAVLISLEIDESDLLTYVPNKLKAYDGPIDDIITFAISAKKAGLELQICNERLYGLIPVPLEDNDIIQKDHEQVLNIKLEAISRGKPLMLNEEFQKYVSYPQPSKLGFSEIYMINLDRREKRLRLMELSFQELGMDVKRFSAVDGRNLDLTDLREFSITLMPNYEDPYHKRPMKAGEVGCFLSHFNIWKEIVNKHHATTLVLEDDIHFVSFFKLRLQQLMNEIKVINWDFLYIGRKILQTDDEEYVTKHTTRPLYSYWTLGYVITEEGAKKLLAAKPLDNLLPVDEYIPIMFDQHPNTTWKSYFPGRNLIALSAAPLLVHPTHYTGQKGYISDTEESTIVDVRSLTSNPKNEL